ncbi:MAG: hypothetical protein A2W26_07670 [Acidobacteria bacterium RBG_16_64_8]|nr:MAG: hypothetical protein A2W26_07670 [Acidobacteria bacterium RBG_16_64_8]
MRKRMTEMAPQIPFDAVIASSLENVYYLSETLILTQRLIPDRLALVLWPSGGPVTFIVCSIEESLARLESWIGDIRGYAEFTQSPIAVLADVLRERGLAGGRLGIETRHLTAAYYEELRRLLPQARLEPGDAFLERVRMVKSADEVQRLEEAATVTDRAIWDTFTSAAPGVTELVISAGLQQRLLVKGAESVAFCVLGSGDRTRMAHPLPGSRVLKIGDILRTDFGGSFRGYYSDLARTAVVGHATPHQRDVYARLWAVHSAVIEEVRPGLLACDVYELCRDQFTRARLEFNMPHVGHGLGIGLHESPLLAPHVEEPLVPGMTLAIEPMHFEPTGERYHVEDLIEVTTDGCRILSRAGKWERLLETDMKALGR